LLKFEIGSHINPTLQESEVLAPPYTNLLLKRY